MAKKYFAMHCNMDRQYLRANPFFHSCVVLIEVDCDEDGNFLSPPHVVDAFGLYSQEFPYKKSFLEDPLAWFQQKLGLNVRLFNGFGEWKRENINDLCLGRGLKGRLFEIDKDSSDEMIRDINQYMKNFDNFFQDKEFAKSVKQNAEQEKQKGGENVREKRVEMNREEKFFSYLNSEIIQLMKAGKTRAQAEEEAYNNLPVSPFHYSVTGKARTCKVAVSDSLFKAAKTQEEKSWVSNLRGSCITEGIPRTTTGLDEIIITACTKNWEKHGLQSQYPYCDWDDLKKNDSNAEIIVVDFGGRYIDREGKQVIVSALNDEEKAIIRDLKMIQRVAQINLQSKGIYVYWQRRIHELIKDFLNAIDKASAYKNAEEFLQKLVNSKAYERHIVQAAPANLTQYIRSISDRYMPQSSSLAYESSAFGI